MSQKLKRLKTMKRTQNSAIESKYCHGCGGGIIVSIHAMQCPICNKTFSSSGKTFNKG